MTPPQVLCIAAVYRCHKRISALMLLFFSFFYQTHLYWSNSNPQQNFKSCPSLKDSAKWERHTKFLLTKSVLKSRENTEYLSLFPSHPQRSLKCISHIDYTWDSVKGDNISARGEHAYPPPTWESTTNICLSENYTWQESIWEQKSLESHLSDIYATNINTLQYFFSQFGTWPSLFKFSRLWGVDIYSTCLLSWRNEYFFLSPFSHLTGFFSTHRNNYSISRPLLCPFSLNIGKAETFMVKREQRGNRSLPITACYAYFCYIWYCQILCRT